MTSITGTKYFVGVVSLNHATIGYNGGFTQACHGKKAPLAQMKTGDWFVQYSPKLSMESTEPYQRFSYIGQVKDGNVYQVEMAPNFNPFRIDIKYLNTETARPTPIRPLIDRLTFIDNKEKWGAKFRFGFLEIPESDFRIIYKEMTGLEMASSLQESNPQDSKTKALPERRARDRVQQ